MNLKVFYIDCAEETIVKVSNKMDGQPRHVIDQASWPSYPYKPDAKFSIAYTDGAILLKYYVQENAIRICSYTTNSPVHRDSCVEFFIAFDQSGYYNLEFNSIGICLAAFGKSKHERELLPAEILSGIRRIFYTEGYTDQEASQVKWQLALVIPVEIFIHHDISYLKDKNCRVNFYKCGDDLPNPHFLSWNAIIAPHPDFHLPEFFGDMQFV